MKTQRVTIGARTFHLELALDDPARIQGLSDRRQIAADGGMLFVLPRPARGGFVMRRCHVPIDLICLDANGRVDSMHAMQVEDDPNAPESRLRVYASDGPYQFAIELRGGTLEQLGLEPGDRIDLPRERLAAMAR